MSEGASKDDTSTGTLTCPSYSCQPGAKLLGVIGPDGRLQYLGGKLSVDNAFVEIARRGRAPELRFRFAGACVKGKCRNWENGGCGLVERILGKAAEISDNDLPACGIRRDCRWFAQRGEDACAACPEVIRGAAPLFANDDS